MSLYIAQALSNPEIHTERCSVDFDTFKGKHGLVEKLVSSVAKNKLRQ